MKKSGAPALAIHLLGGFHVRVSGKPVEEAQWARRQAKQLVKLLALNGKHQLHRQQLIDTIYPDLNAESGAANLHKIAMRTDPGWLSRTKPYRPAQGVFRKPCY